MKRTWLIAVAIAALALALVGCSKSSSDDGTKNPFKGTWRIVSFNVDVTFGNSDYSITIPDLGKFTGNYSYQGEYPDFVASLSVQGQAQASRVNVHFNSEDQFVATDVSNARNRSVFNRL